MILSFVILLRTPLILCPLWWIVSVSVHPGVVDCHVAFLQALHIMAFDHFHPSLTDLAPRFSLSFLSYSQPDLNIASPKLVCTYHSLRPCTLDGHL